MLNNQIHQRLLNDFQQNFPLSPTPYQDIADKLGISEAEVLTAFAELNHQQLISRIGAVIAPNRIGVSSLVAMTIPEAQLSAVAAMINQFPEVNHNYERENHFNLWFVVVARDEAHLKSTLASIEQKTGFKTMSLPLIADYFINLGFNLQWHD